MKKMVRLLVGIAMATALIGATTATGPVATPAAAATYVSKAYKAPKKGQTSSAVKALQQRLIKAKVLNKRYVTSYYGPLTEKAVKKFQKRYAYKQTGTVNKKTWTKLVAKTGSMKVSSAKAKPGRIDKRCIVSGRSLCIDKKTDKLYYLKKGKVVRTYDARFGCAQTKTREGKFSVLWKSRHHVSTIYHSKMPYAMFFSGGQAVHYSSDFAARGYNGCSHGCVNIRARSGIEYVFDQMRVGDPVVVYRS